MPGVPRRKEGRRGPSYYCCYPSITDSLISGTDSPDVLTPAASDRSRSEHSSAHALAQPQAQAHQAQAHQAQAHQAQDHQAQAQGVLQSSKDNRKALPAPASRRPELKQTAATAAMSHVKGGGLRASFKERELVVGKGVVLTANVTRCDRVIVEGQFQGNIKTGTFVLAEGGQMEGEVRCSDGRIGGNMKATIIASKTLLIGKAAVVTGDVMYDSLQVMDGGRLQGKLTHYSSKDKGKDTQEKPEEAMA